MTRPAAQPMRIPWPTRSGPSQRDEGVGRRQRARGVGGGRVTGEVVRLAATPAEVDRAAIAAAAGLRHPRLATEGAEGGGVPPDLGERPRARVVEREAR